MENKRNIFLLLGLLIFMTLGTVYSWSVFRSPLESHLDLTATESGLPYMFFLAFYALTMPIAGTFMHKFGPRISIIFGGTLVGAGWFLAGFANNDLHLIITYGIIAGSGVGVVYGVPIAVAAKWFPDKKGLAVGITLSGFGLSPFVTAPLASIFIEKFGVMPTFQILGASFFIIITILALPFRFPDQAFADSHKSKTLNKAKNHTLKEMIKSEKFQVLFFSYTIGTFVGLMCIGISSPFAEEVIMLDKRTASIFVSIFAIFNGVGRPIFGALTDKFGIAKTAILSFVLIILGSILGWLSALFVNPILFLLGFSIFWLNLGGWLAIAPTATAKLFGDKNYSQNYGVVFLAYGLGAVLGTLISGFIRDHYGSYVFVFYPVVTLSIIGIIINKLIFMRNKNI